MEFKFNEERKNLINFSFLKSEGEFFKGELGQALPTSKGEILLGLGDGDEFDKNKLKKTVYDLLGSYKNIKTLSIPENKLGLDDKDYVLAIVEAALAASYEFDYYKKEKNKLSLEAINFDKNLEKYQDDLNELVNIIDGQNLAKDLVNLRSNDIYPESLAKISSDELSKLGVNVKVYGKEEIHDLGLSAFLEVAKGSERDPKFIVMEYLKGEDSEKPFVFVGKGLTYDSGGYSLKSSNGMKTMNSDMGGAGTVIGAMKAIAKNKLKKNVVAIVAACENLLSGKAYKPGDVIRARNKMTIEVDNTDAEGRITLADAVNYGSSEYSPKIIIDLATLTGAVLSALGETYTGALTNDKKAFEMVKNASDKVDEKIWLLPNDPYFKTYNKSDLADIKNSGGPMAGTITAGQFIESFVKDSPWVHLDIAGTAYLSAPQGINKKNATGVHVKTLYKLVKDN